MRVVRLAPAIVGAALLLSGTAHAQAAAVTKTARNYDCTKAGNANKAVCKMAGAATKPVAAPASLSVAKTTTARNYDCSKAGNANKDVCKSSAVKPAAPAASMQAAPPIAPVAPRTIATRTTTTTKAKTTSAAGPNGATAQCKDGTYSKSMHRSGTCAGHKGVATWY